MSGAVPLDDDDEFSVGLVALTVLVLLVIDEDVTVVLLSVDVSSSEHGVELATVVPFVQIGLENVIVVVVVAGPVPDELDETPVERGVVFPVPE